MCKCNPETIFQKLACFSHHRNYKNNKVIQYFISLYIAHNQNFIDMNLIHCVIKGNAPVHKHSENTSYNNINCIACTINALLHQNKIRCIKFSVCSKGDKSSVFQICLTRLPWIFQWHSSSRWCAIWHWHSLVAHSCIEDNKHVPKHLFQKEGKDLQNVNRQVWTQNKTANLLPNEISHPPA